MSQRVVITGGASGIGWTLVRRFAERGDRIALCDADGAAVARVAASHSGFLARQADVTDERRMAAFLDEVETTFGGADVVCANAGTGGPAGRIETLDYADWQSCIGVNLHGAFLTSRWAARVMRAQGAGLILFTSSTSGLHGVPHRAPYVAAKWGIVGLTKALANAYGAENIRVNAVLPGWIETERQRQVHLTEARG